MYLPHQTRAGGSANRSSECSIKASSPSNDKELDEKTVMLLTSLTFNLQ